MGAADCLLRRRWLLSGALGGGQGFAQRGWGGQGPQPAQISTAGLAVTSVTLSGLGSQDCV